MASLSRAFRPIARSVSARADRLGAAENQREVLLGLVRAAQDTRFGRMHDFSGIRSVEDFQVRVPLRDHDSFREEFWGRNFPVLKNETWPETIPYFALTSGTTSGRVKRIPVSHEMLRSYRRAMFRTLMRHMADLPGSRLFDGRLLMLAGSTRLETLAPGIACGDFSAIALAQTPWLLSFWVLPKRETARLAGWDDRIDRLVSDQSSRKARAIIAQTTWLLSFVERAMFADGTAGSDIAASFPAVELLLCGGMTIAPYRSRFNALVSNGNVRMLEVYAASEGFIAVGDGKPGSGMRPVLDNGVFLEFVPVEELNAVRPTRHWIATVEPKRDYAIVLSTNAGAWAYLLGDIVQIIDAHPPRLVVTGRLGQALSAFGERLIEAEISEAVARAAAEFDFMITEFAVGPIFDASRGLPGHHRFVIEFAGDAPARAERARLARRIDFHLRNGSHDYSKMRSGDLVIACPEVIAAPRAGFVSWMAHQGRLGGLHKMPRILTADALAEFELFMSRSCASQFEGAQSD